MKIYYKRILPSLRIYYMPKLFKLYYFNMVENFRILTAEDTYNLLKQNNVEFHSQEHHQVMTADEQAKIECTKEYNFIYSKNLLLKSKEGRYILYSTRGDKAADFKQLAKELKSKGLRQADKDVLPQIMGVKGGAVTPLALVNLNKENQANVDFVLDKSLSSEYLAVHPMVNTATVWLKTKDLLDFLSKHGINHTIVELKEAEKSEVKVEKPQKKEKELKQEENDPNKEVKHELSIKASKLLEFSDWYSEVISKSEMIDYYDISGCYILRPWAYLVWEQSQKYLDGLLKLLGCENCYFPIFVSEKALMTEKNHVEGFSPEVAWVTHYGESKLENKIAIRPTSETIMYPLFAKWIRSHRDLPLLLNQWANVVRWEFKHPTPFIRTREFLWQEGHTAHATREDADKFMLDVLDSYANTYENILAVPVIKGMKSENEKFAGALHTSTIETLIEENGKAIQCATSHNLGQNFSKMFNIRFLDENKAYQYAWQCSWGFTTRSIGVCIMVHGDDKGLILPPRVSPVQIIMIPIYTSKDNPTEVISKLEEIMTSLLKVGIRAKVDKSELHNPGYKYNYWELKGVPIRIEFGMKDFKKNQVTFALRTTGEKFAVPIDEVEKTSLDLIEKVQAYMFDKAKEKLAKKQKPASDFDSFYKLLNEKNMIRTPWCLNPKCEEEVQAKVKNMSLQSGIDESHAGSVKTLCIPLVQEALPEGAKCFACGEEAKKFTLWGRSY